MHKTTSIHSVLDHFQDQDEDDTLSMQQETFDTSAYNQYREEIIVIMASLYI
jgi:hypothetical protein